MKGNGNRILRFGLRVTGVFLIGLLLVQNQTVTRAAETSQTETEQTEDVITYDAAEFETFQGRTQDEAGRKYTAARYASPRYEDSDLSGLYDESYSEELDPERVLSTGVKETFTAMVNYYRWLAGSCDIEWNDGSHYWLQKEAYKIREEEREEDRSPFKSEYMYSQGNTPLTALKNILNEQCDYWNSMSYMRYSAYRRREIILNPYTPEVYMGFYGKWLVMNLPERYTSREALPFYSFPSQGYMPNDLLTADESAWTVWVDSNKLKIPAAYDKKTGVEIARGVSVKIIHRESGTIYERNMDACNAYADAWYIAFKGPQEDGISAYSGTYDVEVTGLQDKATGKAAKLCYSVTFFDSSEYLLSKVKEVSIDGVDTYVMPRQLASTENGEKVAAILPNEVTVTGENGRSIVLPVKGNWRYDEAGSCWKNSVDASKLPSDLTDPNDVLTDFSIHCEISEQPEMTFEMNWAAYATNYPFPTDGRGGHAIMKCRPESEIEYVTIYQLTKPEEEYNATEKYDTRTAWNVTVDKETNTFSIPIAYFLADTGDYVAVGHAEGSRKAWLSDKIIPIYVAEYGSQWILPTPPNPGVPDGGSAGTGNGSSNDISYTPNGGSSGTSGTGTTGSGETAEQEEEDSNNTSIPKVSKVKKCKVKAKKKEFVLTWKKSSEVSGYEVQISTKKNFKGAKTIAIKKNKSQCKLSKLKPGKKYYIRIRAYQTYVTQTGSKKKSYGKWIVKSSTTKK